MRYNASGMKPNRYHRERLQQRLLKAISPAVLVLFIANPPAQGAADTTALSATSALPVPAASSRRAVTIRLNGSNASATTVGVSGNLRITASVTGTQPSIRFMVNGVAGGNSAVGVITGSYPNYRFVAPPTIPASGKVVTIVAMQAGSGPTAKLTVTITPAAEEVTGHPQSLTVEGDTVLGVDFNLSSTATTLALADVGTCLRGVCSASVTGIEVSASGRATQSCPGGTPSVCTVWLAGQGLTDFFGDPTDDIHVAVSGSDVKVDAGTLYGMRPAGGFSSITFNIHVAANAAPGLRNIEVTIGQGANQETQMYLGAIQVVN